MIAGTGSNSTAEAIELTQHAKEAGADAALVVSPYYNKPTQEGLYQHFKAVPTRSTCRSSSTTCRRARAVDMQVDTDDRGCRKLPNIVGVKDATNDLARPSSPGSTAHQGFILLSGEDATRLGFMAQGGDGCISVTANVAPRLLRRHARCLEGARPREGARDQGPADAAARGAVRRDQPGPVKYAAELLGPCSAEMRLPLADIAEATQEAGARGHGRCRPDQLRWPWQQDKDPDRHGRRAEPPGAASTTSSRTPSRPAWR